MHACDEHRVSAICYAGVYVIMMGEDTCNCLKDISQQIWNTNYAIIKFHSQREGTQTYFVNIPTSNCRVSSS